MEVTVSQLAAETGLTLEHILMLIKRGILPSGIKRGNKRYLPGFESRLILCGHEPGTKWVKSAPEAANEPSIDWSTLI